MTGITTKANTVIPKVVRVNAHWDAEAGVWCASSSNMRGVVTEGATISVLKKRIVKVVKFILEDDGAPAGCTVRVLLAVKNPLDADVAPELVPATKKLAAVFRKSNTPNDSAPLGLRVEELFNVAMAR